MPVFVSKVVLVRLERGRWNIFESTIYILYLFERLVNQKRPKCGGIEKSFAAVYRI